jgi:anti-sigma regulatory factor (Ser/Thr protein kinase)
MTAHSLGLLSDNTSGVGWHWLRSAVEMAAVQSANWPLAADVASSGWTRYPRLATRTPGADPGSVRAARHFTIDTLRQWGLTWRCEDVALVVSELLTNALSHAMPGPGQVQPRVPIRLGLLQPGPCVLCAVADPSELPPVPRQPDDLGETGRGLHVVSALSDHWGYTAPGEAGKVVWAMFSTPDRPGLAQVER